MFLLRRSVEAVADAIGVSRITIYNYLNAIERPTASDAVGGAGHDNSRGEGRPSASGEFDRALLTTSTTIVIR